MLRSVALRAALCAVRISRTRTFASRSAVAFASRFFHSSSLLRTEETATPAPEASRQPRQPRSREASHEIAGEITRARQTPGAEIARRGLAKRQRPDAGQTFTPRQTGVNRMPRSRFHLELSELRQKQRFDQFASRFEQMIATEGMVPDEYILGMAVSAYARLGRFDEAKRHIQKIKALGTNHRAGSPDQDWTSLISAQFDLGKVDEAIATFGEMKPAGVTPTDRVYATLVRGLGRKKQLEKAEEFFSQAKSENAALATTYTAMMANYGDFKQLDKALALFDELKQAKLQPTQMTFTTLIVGCGISGDLARAEKFFYQDMKEANIPHHYSSFGAFVNAFAINDQTDKVFEILKEMKKEGLTPDDYTVSTFVSHFRRDKNFIRLNEAIQVLKEQFQLDVYHLPMAQTALIDVYGARGDFDAINKVLVEIAAVGARPSLYTLGAFFKHGERLGKLEAMVAKLQQMKEARLWGSTYIYNKILDAASKEGAPVDAVKAVVKLMDADWKLNDSMLKARLAELKSKYSL